MSHQISKFIVFLLTAAILSMFWSEWIDRWKNNMPVTPIGILPVEYEYDTTHAEDAEGFVTDIQLSDFDMEHSEMTVLISVDYDRIKDRDREFPALRAIVLNIYEPTAASWVKSAITIPVDNGNELRNSRAGKLSIFSNYSVRVPFQPLGWYPYEVYHIEIEPKLAFSYPAGGRSRGSPVRSVNIPSTLQNHVSEYPVILCDRAAPDPIFKDCESLPVNIHKIIIQQQQERKTLFFLIVILFMFFTMLAFWIHELPNLLEVAVGLLLGIWGLRAVLLPEKIPYRLSWGGENIIMLFYISLAAIILFWLAHSAWMAFITALNNIPNSVFNFILIRFPRLASFVFELDGYWDTKAVARYLGIHPDAVREQARNHHLPGEKVNNRWRFAVQEIVRFRNTQR